jgi:hypothetical protein
MADLSMNYVYLDESGEIEFAGKLPKGYKKNGGLRTMSDPELAAIGWLPMVEVKLDYNRKTHYQARPVMDVQSDKIVFTDDIVAYTEQELEQNKNNDWRASMVNTDIAMPRVVEDILDGMPNKLGVAQFTLDILQAKKDKRSEKP